MSNFFILGMPRCRTTWLTAFLNSEAVFCGHELFSHKDQDPKEFWNLSFYRYSGSVDNDARFAKPYLTDLDAPLVVIERDLHDVYNSLLKEHNFDRQKLKSILYDIHDAMAVAKKNATLVINFKDVDNKLEYICNLCIPEVGYDKVKHEIYKQMHIEPMGIDAEVFNRSAH